MFTSKFYDNIFSSNILRFTLSNLEIEHSLKKKKKFKVTTMKIKNGVLKVSMMKNLSIRFTLPSLFDPKLYNGNDSNFEMDLTKVKATHPWPLDFRFEAHSSMHSSDD